MPTGHADGLTTHRYIMLSAMDAVNVKRGGSRAMDKLLNHAHLEVIFRGGVLFQRSEFKVRLISSTDTNVQ